MEKLVTHCWLHIRANSISGSLDSMSSLGGHLILQGAPEVIVELESGERHSGVLEKLQRMEGGDTYGVGVSWNETPLPDPPR